MMRAFVVVVVCSGCHLYFGDDDNTALRDASSTFADAVSMGADGSLALPCIHAVAANVVSGAAAVIGYSCGPTAVLTDLAYTGDGGIGSVDPQGDWGYQFGSFRAADIDGSSPPGILAFPTGGPFYGTCFYNMSTGGRDFSSISGTPEFVDADVGDIDGDGTLDLVIAGGSGLAAILDDTALTAGFQSPASTPIASGSFDRVAIAGSMLFYVATGSDGSLELGTATQTSAMPLAYELATATTSPSGTVLPLVVGDIDGDGLPDVIGAIPNVFAWLSTTQSIVMLNDQLAKAITVGNLGSRDAIVFAPIDGSGLRRVDVSSMSTLAVSKWTDDDADLIQLADVDGDGTLDAILVHDLNQQTSTITVHFSP